jgi:hypothetical protein
MAFSVASRFIEAGSIACVFNFSNDFNEYVEAAAD